MKETKFNLLEIDLTTGEKRVVDMTKDMRKYLGGRGLGAKILWDRVPEGTGPARWGESSVVRGRTDHRLSGRRHKCGVPFSRSPLSGANRT